jgi:putative selenium metabolism hydrolase
MAATADGQGLISFAQQLAATPSVSGTEQRAVEATADELRRLGFDDVFVDDVGNCIGVIGGGTGSRLLIDGHIDSIPLHSKERWTVDPFGGVIADGCLFGLGICDQKASIAAAAYGLAAARRATPLPGTVALVASVNEEDVEGAALASAVEWFGPDFAITTEPSDTRLCIGQRGRAKVSVRVVGRAVHAGHARLGVNAAEGLAALIEAVRRVDHPAHPRLGKRDITCIDLASLPYPSVSTVAGEALARFDCRFVPGETEASLLSVFKRAAGMAWADWADPPTVEIDLVSAAFSTWRGRQFAVSEFEAAWWTDESSPLVEAAVSALTESGFDGTPTHYSFCTNGSYLAGVARVPTIGFGVGLEQMAHQVDEHVAIESLRKGAIGFSALARRITAIGWGHA